MKRKDLIVSECEMPTGYRGYYLSNKENTLRYSFNTMFKYDLDTCEVFETGIPVNRPI